MRLAGPFLAWSEGWVDGSWSVVVYDLAAGKESYRARPIGRVEYSGQLRFDLQRDGKVLVAYQRPSNGVMYARLAWFSAQEPELQVLPFRALIPESRHWSGVRFADDEYAVERLRDGGRSELVIADLKGRLVARLASFHLQRQPWGEFDFDGERAVWAEQQTTKRTFLPCASGADHCPIREQGWITILLADRQTGWKPRSIARSPFTFYEGT